VRTVPTTGYAVYSKNGLYHGGGPSSGGGSALFGLVYNDWIKIARATSINDDLFTAVSPGSVVVPPEGGHLPSPSPALRLDSAFSNLSLGTLVRRGTRGAPTHTPTVATTLQRQELPATLYGHDYYVGAATAPYTGAAVTGGIGQTGYTVSNLNDSGS